MSFDEDYIILSCKPNGGHAYRRNRKRDMGKIFCIIGKSSTGKDTLYQRILERKDLQLRQIVSYTTRPIRAGEVDGTEFIFVRMRRRMRCSLPEK